MGWVGIWVVVGEEGMEEMGCKGFIFGLIVWLGGVEVVTKRDTCSE